MKKIGLCILTGMIIFTGQSLSAKADDSNINKNERIVHCKETPEGGEWHVGSSLNAIKGKSYVSNYYHGGRSHGSTAERNGVFVKSSLVNRGYWSNAQTTPDWKETNSSSGYYRHS